MANFPHIAQDVNIDPTVKIIGDVYIHEKTKIMKNVILSGKGGRLVIGKNVKIDEGTNISSTKNRLVIGDNADIGKKCEIKGDVGENSVLKDNVVISSTSKIGKNCVIESDQELTDISIDDGTHYE